jgi:tRNA pseudouridine38-40 synthase
VRAGAARGEAGVEARGRLNTLPTFKITLAYDGTDFVGWQRQATGISVQGLLEDALRALDDRDVTVHGAGRTDAGVHALGQVASFSLVRAISADVVQRSLNANLPLTVRVLSAEDAPDDFHARFHSRGKAYRYRLWNADVLDPFERRYAWHVYGALDLPAMQAAAALIEGTHDFAAFQGQKSDVRSTVRNVWTSTLRIQDCGMRIEERGVLHSAIRSPQSALLIYEIAGSGFLRHMVRAIVGTLVEIGRGRKPVDWMNEVLASRDRAAAGQTAPAEGLFLVAVHY